MIKAFSNNFLNFPKIQYKVFGIKFKRYFPIEHYDEVNIVFHESEGIGNRIFGVANCINLLSPGKINIYWDTTFNVTEKFSNLFSYNGTCKITEHNNKDICKKWFNNNKILTLNIPCVELQTREKEGLEQKYNSISPEVLMEYSEFFQNLKPTSTVQERILSLTLPENYVSLQVRNNSDWLLYGRNEDLKLFFDEIEKLPQNTIFYLSAMNQEIANIFKERYGERIITLDNKHYNSMTDAVADLYILSKAQNAIYSYGSTFSELAFWIAKGQQKVTLVGSKTNWHKLKDGKPIKRKKK